jgi:protein-tyrosine phosphatase
VTRPRPRRLLTVCLGNHPRSPLAGVIRPQTGGIAAEIRSAGIRDKWAGPPDHQPQMVTPAAARGYDLSTHCGTHMSRDLWEWANLVLAMDGTNLAAPQGLADERTAPKLALYLGDRDVPDPSGVAAAAFDPVVQLVEDSAARHLT